jgi:hypothetical protein
LIFLADDLAPSPDIAAAYAECFRRNAPLAVRGSIAGAEDVSGAAVFRFQRGARDHVWCLDLEDNTAVRAGEFFRLGGFDERLPCGEALDLSIRIYAHSRDAGTQRYCAAASAKRCSEFSLNAHLARNGNIWDKINGKYGKALLFFFLVISQPSKTT